jgi:5-methylcytosine-specific restriction endonuclease McrA
VTRCEKDGYALVGSLCPICDGRQPGSRFTFEDPTIPPIPVTPPMFQTRQHYDAWRAGAPLRTQRDRRWKVPAKWKDSVKRHFGYRCQWPGCGTRDLVTIEHIVPVVLGGSNEPANLTLLCSSHQRESWQRFAPLLRSIDAA